MKTILVTTDLSNESKKAFPYALKLAQAFDAKVVLLAVVEDPAQVAFAYAMDFPIYPDPTVHQQVLKKVETDLKDLLKECFSQIPSAEATVMEAVSSVPSEIIAASQALHADMIVISSHGRSGISRLLIGSVAERVLREATCPVLVVPAKSN